MTGKDHHLQLPNLAMASKAQIGGAASRRQFSKNHGRGRENIGTEFLKGNGDSVSIAERGSSEPNDIFNVVEVTVKGSNLSNLLVVHEPHRY